MKKSIKVLLISVGVLAAVILGGGALLPSSYKVSREMEILTSPENIFTLTGDLKEWSKWSPWQEMDTAAVYEYSPLSKGAGATMKWKGKKVGTGELFITQYKKYDLIKYQYNGIKPFRFTSQGTFTLTKTDNGVKVTWTDEGKLAWPHMRWMGLFMNMDKMLGEKMERGLTRMKAAGEAMPMVKLPKIQVEVKEMQPILLAGIRTTCSTSDIGKRIGECYAAIGDCLKKKNIVPENQPPLCIYHRYTESETEMEPALVVPPGSEGAGEVVVHPSYAGQVMMVRYYGNYNNMSLYYKAMEQWMEENHKSKNGPPWESYVTDPGTEPDTAKWLTEIYWPIR